jgi:hypothetical protein
MGQGLYENLFKTAYSEGHDEDEQKKRIAAQLVQQLISSGQMRLTPGMYEQGPDGPTRMANPNTTGVTREPISFVASPPQIETPKRTAYMRKNEKTGLLEQIPIPEGYTDMQFTSFDPTKGQPSQPKTAVVRKTPQQEADMRAYNTLLDVLKSGEDPSDELLQVAIPAGERLELDMAPFKKKESQTFAQVMRWMKDSAEKLGGAASTGIAQAKTAFASGSKPAAAAKTEATKAPAYKTGAFEGKQVPAFASEQEAEKAKLPPGTIILIGGKPARVP